MQAMSNEKPVALSLVFKHSAFVNRSKDERHTSPKLKERHRANQDSLRIHIIVCDDGVKKGNPRVVGGEPCM
jgi:hypothetical protein